MTEKVMDILYSASEEIAQMFCDKLISDMAAAGQIIGITTDEWDLKCLNIMGFTEQQIINSLEKLKAK